MTEKIDHSETKKITQEELEVIIMEELDKMDEGWWDELKGMGGGVMNALTSPLGKVGQGYKRGKASSALRGVSFQLEKVRKNFMQVIESLFKPAGADRVVVPPEIQDVQDAWMAALGELENVSEKFEQLSLDVKRTVTRRTDQAQRGRLGGTPAPAPAPAEE